MLLPSALPCDILMASQRPQRPKLPSFTAYAPQQADSYAGGLIASCRALHSILGGPLSSITSSHLGPSLQDEKQNAPISCPRPDLFTSRRSSSSPRIVTPPRGQNKRKREIFEEENDHEKENIPQSPRDRELYQTPKRRRLIPVDMPLGLSATDFASLGASTPTTPRRERDEDIQMPPLTEIAEQSNSTHMHWEDTVSVGMQTRSRRRSGAQSQQSNHQPNLDPDQQVSAGNEQWSPLDDRRLVEIVLSKLSLSRRDWNDCAKQLGKDKDSLGRRWKILIGEGNVGLRRGLGRHERGDLDIKSW